MALDLRQSGAFPIPVPSYAPPTATHPFHQTAVEQVILALRQRVRQPLSLCEMADMVSLSPFHFNRVFKRVTGIPPYEFLATLRLDAARRMLLTTSMSVTDVCFELGYSSLGTFTTRFTQRIGMSPGHLRRVADAFESPSPGASAALAAERAERMGGVLPWPRGATVAGRVAAPAGFAGLIFVGLFASGVPQGRPLSGTLLAEPGVFRLAAVPDGCYHLLVAAIPYVAGAYAYLVPGADDTLLVGTRERAVVVRGGRAMGPCDVLLRQPHVTDPPVLVSLPYLLG